MATFNKGYGSGTRTTSSIKPLAGSMKERDAILEANKLAKGKAPFRRKNEG